MDRSFKQRTNEHCAREKRISLLNAWFPYVLVAILLVITRTVTEVKTFLTGESVTILIDNLFNSGIAIKSTPLYLPGTIFLIVSLVTYVLHRMDAASYKKRLAIRLKRH